MTDYLEPRQGENEDALWEAVRLLNALFRNTGDRENGSEEETVELSRGKENGETDRTESSGAADRAEDAGTAALRATSRAMDRTKDTEEAVRTEVPETVDRTEHPEATALEETLETADRAGSMGAVNQAEKLMAMARENGEEKRSTLLPLLNEVEALDRTLEVRELLERTRTSVWEDGPAAGMGRNALWAGPDGFRRETGPRTELLWHQSETEQFIPGGSTSVWTDEDLQAERLDQVFRRDSRRYDGGFFLY